MNHGQQADIERSDGGSLPLRNTRHFFDVPEEIVYLNCANIAPRLLAVTQAGWAAMDRMARPWTIAAEDWFSGAERLRALFATLVNTAPDNVALVPSVSYGIAVAAANVGVAPGSNVIVLDRQYPSNYYAWRRVCADRQATIRVVPSGDPGSQTDSLLQRVDADTAVIAVPNCHWTDGTLIDLERVGAAARQVGASLVVDASQSLGACPLDVNVVRPDFLVSVGYKWLLGPYGLSYLYVDEKWHEGGKPIEDSWLTRAGSEDFSRLVEYVDEFRPGARRFDAGEFPQFISIPMASAALSQVLEWGVPNIQTNIAAVTGEIADGARNLGFDSAHPGDRVGHLLALSLPSGLEKSVGDELAKRGIYVAVRGDRIRISPHLHTSKHDVDRLFAGLAALQQ